jgi:hypothetical protein
MKVVTYETYHSSALGKRCRILPIRIRGQSETIFPLNFSAGVRWTQHLLKLEARDTSLEGMGLKLFAISEVKGKGKVTPKQAYVAFRGPGGKAPGFLDNRHIKVVRLSALRTGRLYPQEYPGTHFERLSRPRAHGLVGCLGKNPQ